MEKTSLVCDENGRRFLDEMKGEIEKQYLEFVDYQRTSSRVFSVFHEICKRNKIPYYLAFGTLLGSVRDGGQIPWDYDIDVFVPFTESAHLIAALDSELTDEYYYDTRLKNRKCRHYSIKMAPKGYNCTILHLDIFWLVGESGDRKERERHKRIRTLFYNRFLFKYHDTGIRGAKTKTQRAVFRIRKFLYSLIPAFLVERAYLRVIALPLRKDGWCATCGRGEGAFKFSWFGDGQLVVLPSGAEVSLPQDSESILTALYGDYRRYPEIRERMDEFHQSLMRLEEFARASKEQ